MIEPVQNCLAEDTFPAPKWYPQQIVWIQNPSDPENVAYNYPLALRMRGPLDQTALKRSVQEIVRRHQVLRSAFRIQDGCVVQVIRPPQPLKFPVVDLSTISETEREAKALHLALDDARRPFELSRGPLLRAKLLHLNPEDHLFLLTTHHIVSDDWSMGILLRELSLVYGAFAAGQSSPLSDVSFQYGDFVRQQQKCFEKKKLECVAFWKQQLADTNDFRHLAPDHIQSERQTYRGTHQRTILSESLTNSLKTLSQQEKVTPFMAFLGALQCLLCRYSGQYDIGVASCVANRSSSQVEKVVGHFSNHVVLRTNLAGNPTFREVLHQVRKVSLTASSYQELPFGSLVEQLQPRSGASTSCHFQVLLVLTDAPKEEWNFSGLEVSLLPLDLGTAPYDLIVWLKLEDRLEVDLQYNSDVFEAATVVQIVQDYRTVLEMMSTNPEARLRDLAIARPEPASTQLLSDRTSREYLAPRDTIESQLVKLWEDVLEKRHIGIYDDFFELGGTSLLAARLFAQLEETFKLKIPLATLIPAPTIEKLAQAIRQPAACDTWRSLVPIQPNGVRPPLFCSHGESGNLLIYRGLAEHLGSDQPVYGLQPQGLDGKELPLTQIEEMAANYVRAVQRIQPEGPYFLAGYCMGGTIAFEMAQQLRRQGQSVGLLALLDTYNWRIVKPTLLSDLYFNLQKYWFGWKHFLQMASRNKLGSTQARFDEGSNESKLSECNRHAALNYVPKVYPGRILQVRPAHQYARYDRPELGWSEFAADGLEVFSLPALPGGILEEPCIRDLAAKLRTCITQAAAKGAWTPTADTFEPVTLPARSIAATETLRCLPNPAHLKAC